MPIYEFKCRACGRRFEAIRPMGDSGSALECPDCGAGTPEKQLSVFAASTGWNRDARPARSSCRSGFS
ncbi:MAG: zinc ribbon domain-containing protein [Acidobacteriia bacterium]|nr:zinc ribbon domain-containing protein [Terriglobia bacterium]